MRSTVLAVILSVLVPTSMPLLAGCTPEAAGPSDFILCESDDDCRNDNLFCNGVTTCVVEMHMGDRGPWRSATCERGDPPCARELCDEATDHCACFTDDDGDGAESVTCGGTDCDDSDPTRYPGGTELCDLEGHDEDCDPTTFGTRDADDDGSVDATCCNDEVCGSDCNDQMPGVHRFAVEACDQIDNDCDGAVDESVLVTSYQDTDGDGWGTGEPDMLCAGTPHYATVDGDCDDALSQIHPGAFRCIEDANIEFCADDATWTADACPGSGLCVPQPDGTGVCLPEVPECSDGVDNDGDGETDRSDPQCDSPLDNSEDVRECADGMDNDGDGLLDFPNDPGCISAEDNTEAAPPTPPACSNGLDDDGDGTVDYVGGNADPGCVSAADASEREATGPTCDNGLDDDQDPKGLADFPADAICLGPGSDAEHTPACSNGLDDDFDGTIDFPSDPGCTAANDDGERAAPNSNYVCDNTLDDDGDGVSDYPGDPGCSSMIDSSEL